MTTDIRTITTPMPGSIRSCVVLKDDIYTILINETLSQDARLKAYEHEMEHIKNEDFNKECSVNEIEYEAHKKQ